MRMLFSNKFFIKCIIVSGFILFLNAGTTAQQDQSIEYWQSIAQKNPDDAKAWFNIGVLYETGQSTEKNQTKAHDAYQKSIALGYAPAMYNLGSIYAKQKDYENARLWWEKAAELDLPEAQYNMGMLYEKGWGVTVNPQLSSSWYQRAAETAMEKYFQLYQKSRSEHPVELVPSESSISVFDRLLFIKTAFAASSKLDSDAVDDTVSTSAIIELAQSQDTTQNATTTINQQPRSPGWDWVYSQPAESYTIQLFATKDIDKTGKFIQQYALSERAQVIQAIVKGTTYYKVLLGSFDEWNDAAVEIGAFPQDLRNQRPWVRKFNSLYKELPDTIIASSESSTALESKQPEAVEEQAADSNTQLAQENNQQTGEQASQTTNGQDTSSQTQAVIEESSDQTQDSTSDQQATDENTQQAEITQAKSNSAAADTVVEDDVEQVQDSATLSTAADSTNMAEKSADSERSPENDEVFSRYVNQQLASSGLSDELKLQLKSGLDAIAAGEHERGYNDLSNLAQSGLPEAQYRVALLYFDGNGVGQDAGKAFEFMKAASEQGHPYAQQSLAKFYVNGVGVEANTALATYWQQTAADNIKKLELQ